MLRPGERRRGDLSRTPSDADTAGGPRTVWHSLTIDNGEERGHDWTMLARTLASTHTNNTRHTRTLGISQRRRFGFPREMCYLRKRRRKCRQAAGRSARCSVRPSPPALGSFRLDLFAAPCSRTISPIGAGRLRGCGVSNRAAAQQQRQRQHRRKDAVQLGLRDGCLDNLPPPPPLLNVLPQLSNFPPDVRHNAI